MDTQQLISVWENMLPIKLVTYENVANAAKKIAEGGKQPSVRSVIALIGGGSPNAVLPLLTEWKSSRPDPQHSDVVLDPAIAQLIARQVETAATHAAAAADAKVIEIQADADLIAETGRAVEKLNEQLQKELDQSRAQIQQLTGQLDARAREIEKVSSDAAEQVAAADTRAARERDAAEAVRQELVRAQIRVESIPRLESDTAALNARVHDAETALAVERQVAAVATAKSEAQLLRADESAQRETITREQIQRLEKDLAEVRALERAALERVQQLGLDLFQAQAKIPAPTHPAQ
jgi:acetolactate synthase regulatory subunit